MQRLWYNLYADVVVQLECRRCGTTSLLDTIRRMQFVSTSDARVVRLYFRTFHRDELQFVSTFALSTKKNFQLLTFNFQL